MLAQNDIAREARRILRRLSVARTLLAALPQGQYAVARGRAQAAASRVRIGADYVREFSSRGWIASDGDGCFVIAPAGLGFLAACAPDDDRFAAQHRLMATKDIPGPDGAPRRMAVNMGESPLARLAFKSLIDPVQFAAGEKLRRDFTMAQMMPRMGVDWSAPAVSGRRGGAGAETVSEIALAAKQRLRRALDAAGPELGDLLFDVCCHLMALELAEAQRSWSKRSGRVVLKIALDRLAAHYGLTGSAPMRAKMRSWAMEAAPD